MSATLTLHVPDAAAMEALGAALARARRGRLHVYLRGDLGAGKTTLVRGFLRAAGHRGSVRSPTYTLVEPYELDGSGPAFHLDLYRLAAAEELEYLGVRDLEHPDGVLLVEWPERGAGALPPADLDVLITYRDGARRAALTAVSSRGVALLERLQVPPACAPQS